MHQNWYHGESTLLMKIRLRLVKWGTSDKRQTHAQSRSRVAGCVITDAFVGNVEQIIPYTE